MNKIITLFVCFAFFFCTFTPIQAFVQGGQAISMLIPSILIFFLDKVYKERVVFLLIAVLSIVIIMGVTGVSYFENWVGYSVLLTFSIMGLEHFMIKRDHFYLKWVIISFYSTLIILALISIPQFILIPGLARMMVEANDDPSVGLNYYWSISYQTIHAIPILTIPLIAQYNSEKGVWKKCFLLLVILSLIVVMFLADATTSLIMMVATIVFFVLYNKKRSIKDNLVRIAIISVLALPIFSKQGLSVVLHTIQPIFQGTSNYKKVDELILFAESGDTSGDMEGREELYNVTLKTIGDNPLFPSLGSNAVGGHSYMLDHFAVFGFFLFIPFALLIYNRYRRPLKLLGNYKIYYIVSFASLIFLSIFKNFFIIDSGFVIVPLFLIWLNDRNSTKRVRF